MSIKERCFRNFTHCSIRKAKNNSCFNKIKIYSSHTLKKKEEEEVASPRIVLDSHSVGIQTPIFLYNALYHPQG